MKKVFTLILLSMIAFNAIHAKITWTLSDDGTLTISGTGGIVSYYWSNKRDKIRKVIIENGATSIGDAAFYECSNLSSITIPNSVTSIGSSAFSRCSGLTSITIPNSVTSIGNSAFSGCLGLTSVTIPNSVTSIGYGVLMGCKRLESIVVEKGNKKFDCINDCNAIIDTESNMLISGCKNTVIPNYVTIISDYAFDGCRELESIILPESVTTISNDAFHGCRELESIILPESVTYIGDRAFSFCTKLKSINIPNSVTWIGTEAFCQCYNLGTLTIPESVWYIGSGAFIYSCISKITCHALTPPNVTSYDFRDTPYNSHGTLYVPPSAIYAYQTAEGWKEWTNILPIEDFSNISFANTCEDLFVGTTKTLETITIPKDVVNKTITWTSSNTGVATVSAEGVVTANSVGTTIITVKTHNGKTATCTITVKQPVTTIALSDATASLYVGETKTLTATVTPTNASNTELVWESSNTSVAEVSSEGVVTAKKSGSCTITCTAADGSGTKSTCSITVKQPPITLSDATALLWVGETKKITATTFFFPFFASNYTVEWSSSDTKVATVSTEGEITAKGKGTCTIICTAADKTDYKAICEITVKQQVTSITISDATTSLWVGDTKNLTATTTPTTASNTAVDWSSSNANIATVSPEGVITAKGKGTCTITCTAADGYGTKSTCEVTVKQQVTAIAIDNVPTSLLLGDTKTITAKVTPTTANNTVIKWSSSDNKVATVSSEGMITAKGKGTCTITCTAADGYGTKTTFTVTVIESVTSVALSEVGASLWVGETKSLTAKVIPTTASNTVVNWSSSNASVATVSSEGVITARGKGNCTITCTAADGYGAKSSCEVTVKQQVKAITLRNIPTSLIVGDKKTVTTTVTPTTASNTAVEWSSSDANVATVSSRGVITAKGKGTCTITCTAADGYGTKTSFTITVKEPAISIALSETSASLWVGDTKIITATITPTTAGNTAITWSSSDDNVATVSSKGVITAKGKGTCTITCTAADGYSTKSECKVTVKQQVTSIDLGNETLILTCGAEKILIPTISPSNADVQAIAWTSTDKNVATISADGVLKALSPGTTKIICTATDGFNKESSITVNVVPFKISDDKPDIADGTYGEGGIAYTRTMEKNKCDVFCMPYDVILSDYTDNFTKVYILSGMAIHKPNGTTLIPLKEVSLTETISAGQPFVAYAAKSGQVVLKNSSKVTIASLAEPNAIKLDVYDYVGNSITSNHDIDMTITGNYIKKTGLDKANNFVFSTNGTMTKATSVSPYRFYITKNDERSSAKISDIELSFDEDVTGIEELLITNGSNYIYNLKGQRINKSNVQKGVYIINGRKEVIK